MDKTKKKKQIRALVLFSGGLDSTLTVKILEAQNIKVDILNLTSLFFCTAQAKKTSKTIGKKLRTLDASKKHLEVIKNPKHGYGQAINPCTDCHILMIKEAKKIFNKEGYDILATGEVVGQRPKSQKIEHLKLIEKETGLQGKILRPLSAKVLEETIFEKEGLVDRKKLPGISGRSRKEQIALTKKYKVKDYPTPAGGCILTDKNFAEKLKTILHNIKVDKNDISLLRSGRFFDETEANIIVGRTHEENLKLKKLVRGEDILMEAKNDKGPLTLIRFYEKPTLKRRKEIIKKAADLTKHHSTRTRNLDKVQIYYWNKNKKKKGKTIIV